MKKKIYFLFCIILFFSISTIRFIQLNQSTFGQKRYTEVKYNSYFDLNGITFNLKNVEILNDVNIIDGSDLKCIIELYKSGNVNQDLFNESFPEEYPTSIKLNITDKNENLIGNYSTEYEGYEDDNKKFLEIQKGARNLDKNKDIVILRFRLSNSILENIKNKKYNLKLVFPKNKNYINFNFISFDNLLIKNF